MGEISPGLPVLLIVCREVAGAEDIQQQMHRGICGKITDFGVKPLPGRHIEDIVGVMADFIISKAGQKNDGNLLFMEIQKKTKDRAALQQADSARSFCNTL